MSSSPEPMHVRDFNEIFMKMFPPICEIDIIPSQHPTHKTTNETLPDCPKRLAKLKSWTSPCWPCAIFLGISLNIELKSFPKGSFSYIIIVSIIIIILIIILIMIILEELWGRDLNQIYQLHLQDSESSPRDFIPTSEIHFLFKTKIHFVFKPKQNLIQNQNLFCAQNQNTFLLDQSPNGEVSTFGTAMPWGEVKSALFLLCSIFKSIISR